MKDTSFTGGWPSHLNLKRETLAGRPEEGPASMTKGKAGIWLFATVSIISFIAALIPVLKGEQPNGVFLGSGTVFLVVAIASARKARTGSNKEDVG